MFDYFFFFLTILKVLSLNFFVSYEHPMNRTLT